MNIYNINYKPFFSFTVLIFLWEICARNMNVRKYIFPYPSDILKEVIFKIDTIVPNVLITMIEAISGFFLGMTCALIFSVGFSIFRPMREYFFPLFIALQAIPLISLAPFVNMVLGTGYQSKIVLAALICYLPATVIMTNGLLRVERDHRDFLKILGASRLKMFTMLALPTAVPQFATAVELSAILCVVGAVVAELAGAGSGAGFLILEATYQFRTAFVFAVIACLGLATIAWYYTINVLAGNLLERYSLDHTFLS